MSSTMCRPAAAGTAWTGAVPTVRSRIRRSSPLTVAAVVDGRRLYGTRADLQTVIATEDAERAVALADVITGLETTGRTEPAEDPDGRARRGLRAAITAVNQVGSGGQPSDDELASSVTR